MATKSASLRFILELFNDTGEDAATRIDEVLALSGWTVKSEQTVVLGPSAADQAVTLSTNGACLLLIYSEDEPFSLRLATGETLMPNVRLWLVMSDDLDEESVDTSVLLTGNGDNQANLHILELSSTTAP